jgi:hypothetical protein
MNAPVDPYETVQYFNNVYSDGSPMLVTRRALQALELLRTRLGYTDPLTMYQGCNHKGVVQSAQTHWGADVFDISAYEYERKAKLGAAIGIIVFHRPFNWDGAGGMEHCHILIKGSKHFNPQAAQRRWTGTTTSTAWPATTPATRVPGTRPRTSSSGRMPPRRCPRSAPGRTTTTWPGARGVRRMRTCSCRRR